MSNPASASQHSMVHDSFSETLNTHAPLLHQQKNYNFLNVFKQRSARAPQKMPCGSLRRPQNPGWETFSTEPWLKHQKPQLREAAAVKEKMKIGPPSAFSPEKSSTTLFSVASHHYVIALSLYVRGSQPGVHVPPGVHLPIRRGTFKVSNRRENVFAYYLFPNIYTYISDYYFQKS